MLEIKELEEIFNKLNNIERTFGIGGVILVITLTIVIVWTWNFFKRSSELIAEKAAEKSLKKFQNQLDKDLAKFQVTHQKQVDGIHDIFQKYQQMTSLINYLLHGENFVQKIDPTEEIDLLIKYRHSFKSIYQQNRLLLPEQLCIRIDALFPIIDEFIVTYSNGLLPEQSPDQFEDNTSENNGFHLAGIWKIDAFDESLRQLEQIAKDIEMEFRNIYGTNE